MREELKHQYLRFFVSVNGEELLPEVAFAIHSGLVNSDYLKEFDAQTQTFEASYESLLLEVLLDFYNENSVMPSLAILQHEINAQQGLNAKERAQYRDIVMRLKRMNAQVAEWKYVQQEVVNNYLNNQASGLMVNTLEKAKENPRKAFANLSSELFTLVSKTNTDARPQDKPMTMAEFVRYKQQEREENEGVLVNPCASYGYYHLDLSTGGMFPAELTAIAGKYSTGKSVFLQDIATHCAFVQKKPAVLLNLENSHVQAYPRLLAKLTKISIKKIMRNNLTKSERKLIKKTERRLIQADLPLLMLFRANHDTPAKLKRAIYQWGEKPALVAIDYIDIMQSNSQNGRLEPYQRVKAVTDELKFDLSVDLHCHVLTATQLNREGAKQERPTVNDLRFHSINTDADTVILFWHSKENPYKGPESDEYDGTPGDIYAEIARGRSTSKNFFKFQVDFTKMEVLDQPITKEEIAHIESMNDTKKGKETREGKLKVQSMERTVVDQDEFIPPVEDDD